ncbi:hypothetical protein STCU_04372 [Strigomonas culicis]|uniref:Uncharacterized protein n=1 Tax=Strigomonas culicis TaxID=28005 RepID=S9ULP6_9TRYP|nr:hypothetical protein STCU_04372 [Strigomonas culicis]|eukprot:EPY29649.1 hypothetical protein STCU_04372 [Strigomonas culicis]
MRLLSHHPVSLRYEDKRQDSSYNQKMEKLARSSMNYTLFGLAGGFYYRELTRHVGFDRAFPTQLRAFHTHCISLGTLYFLLVLVLEKQFKLSKQKDYKKFYISYNIGLGFTLLMMLAHGTMTVLGKEESSHWMRWPAGLGHLGLSTGFYYFFKVLRAAIRDDVAATAPPSS